MIFTVEQLTSPVTVEEAKAATYAVMEKLGVNTTGWFSGSVVRAIVTANSILVSACSELVAAIAKAGFLDTAEGAWLDLLAYYNYGVERIPATFAKGIIRFSNTGGGIYSFDPDDVIVTGPTGKTYRNTEAFNLNPGDLNVEVTFAASEAGIASGAAPNTLTTLETAYPNVSLTNPAAFVGAEKEEDIDLRIRCREKLSALSPNGPRDAYSYWAKSAKLPSGESAGVTRVKVSSGSMTGHVTVTVASAGGAVTGSTSDPGTSLGAVNSAIQSNVVPEGVTCDVVSAIAAFVDVTYSLRVLASSGLTSESAQALVVAALPGFFATQPIGGTLDESGNYTVPYSLILSAIAKAVPGVCGVQVSEPTDNVVIASNGVPMLGPLICSSFTQVAG